MSRPDHHDEYPPGLHVQQRPPDRVQYPALRAAAAATSGAGLGAYTATMQRSHAMQESRDFPFLPEISGQPNRHNATPALSHLSSSSPFLAFNHNNHRPSPPPLPAAFPSSSPTDRDPLFLRHPQPALPQQHQPAAPSIAARSTLWWGELEPWMDEEYAKQVCSLMKWDPVSIKVPHPAPDPTTGQQPNNPGYCFITFPSPAYAASVLAQVATPAVNGSSAITMPNSTKPFVMNWASSVTSASSPMATSFSVPAGVPPAPAQQYPKEYSIFVGDLAPETSNSDLVAVFRNPVLGLRNDREPKFIRPFLSCKSAKIMLDPLTGVSRGYGFVRFTDEADQQRALIEMHGLYCLSRPMRISPATAKFKAPSTVPAFDLQQVSYTPPALGNGADVHNTVLAAALPAPGPAQNKSVSAPIAAAGSNMSLSSNAPSSAPSASSIGGSLSSNSLSSGTGSSTSISTSAFANSPDDVTNDMLARLAQQYADLDISGYKNMPSYHQDAQMDPARYMISEESWKHHAQARAILGNLIGPNGEQLTSTDPYNTTVFVGGLSPLISEETLRTFFAPFGDIHYVKVPVGKHCGFVQFVRKADAEKAIEKMQGFPIGGSRIRLSWGRSQYKAAQAAAQAAQSASILPQFPQSMAPLPAAISQEQAMNILQKFNAGYYNGGGPSGTPEANEIENALLSMRNEYGPAMLSSAQLQQKLGQHIMQQRQQQQQEQHPQAFQHQHQQQQQQHLHDENSSLMNNYGSRVDAHRASLNFSPFSPEPNNLYMSSEPSRRDSYSRLESLPHPSKAYAPGFFPMQHGQDLKVSTGSGNPHASKISPTATRPTSGNLYGFSDNSDPPTPINRVPGRAEAPISRPGSGQMAMPSQSELQEIQDLNGTLASLDLDRPWKSPEAAGSR